MDHWKYSRRAMYPLGLSLNWTPSLLTGIVTDPIQKYSKVLLNAERVMYYLKNRHGSELPYLITYKHTAKFRLLKHALLFYNKVVNLPTVVIYSFSHGAKSLHGPWIFQFLCPLRFL